MSKYKLSGYTTCRNAIQMDYPLVEVVENLLSFCDEVVVADSSDGSDSTLQVLENLMNKHSKLEVYHVNLDWTAKNHGVYDGQMKAYARSKCTGDYLWQQDLDEIAEDNVREKIDALLDKSSQFMDQNPIIALPVVEYWGSNGKVRIDINPWKERLSKNLPNITHGIPASLRKYEDGLLYSKHGSDTCNLITKNTGEPIAIANFVTPQVEEIRRKAIFDTNFVSDYQNWYNMITDHLPTIYHFSWYSISTKIKNYKQFWNGFWQSMYNETRPEGWNPFFANKSLTEVTDEEIVKYAKYIEATCGGHIFHTFYNGQKTNHVRIEKEIPSIMKNWCDNHKD